MTERPSDPTGEAKSGVRRNPTGNDDDRAETAGIDEEERDLVTGGTAATSELADDEAAGGGPSGEEDRGTGPSYEA